MKKTKIIATVGPACMDYEILKELALSGVNVFRLNFSHGEHDWHKKRIKDIRKLEKELQRPLPIMLDTKGPEIRTGDLKEKITLEPGQEITLTVDEKNVYEKTGKISVNYSGFVKDVVIGEKVLIDNGVMNFEVLRIDDLDVICSVLDGGEMGSRRHLNLPMKEVSLEAITQKDWKDIQFGVDNEIDFVAMSFVRSEAQVLEVQNFLIKQEAQIQVIAKIESFEATKNIDAICKYSDGVMVARGDLGAEVPLEEVPVFQRKIIEACQKYRTPVIVATHMLESMTENPIPTRAEISDVSNAVWQRADAIMLSGETASGEYPLKSVQTMALIAKAAEKDSGTTLGIETSAPIGNIGQELVKSVALMTADLDEIKAIMVLTRSGTMARTMASFRPNVPIFSFTPDTDINYHSQLLRGVESFEIEFEEDPLETIEEAQAFFLENFPGWKGDKFALISDSLVEGIEIPMVQIRTF